MESDIHSCEMEQIRELAEVLTEMISQFIRTREELMRTTLQVQIELLSNRLKRLKVSIIEIKSQIDTVCVPEEVSLIEEELGDRMRPYDGAEIVDDGTIQEFSWKSTRKLEKEKNDFLSKISDVWKDKATNIYDLYIRRSSFLYRSEEKSHLR